MSEQQPVTYDQVQSAMQKGRHLQGAARAQILDRVGATLSRLVHRIARNGEHRQTYLVGEPANEILVCEPRSSFVKAA